MLRGDGRGEGLRDIGRGEWVRGDTGQPTDDDQQGGGGGGEANTMNIGTVSNIKLTLDHKATCCFSVLYLDT